MFGTDLRSATMTRTHVLRPKIFLSYVNRPKISSTYVSKPKLRSPILYPTRNHVGTIHTYILRAGRKTPTTNLVSYSGVRRIHPIRIFLGDHVVPTRRKLMREVLPTVRVFICTVRTDLRYIRSKSMQVYRVYEFLNSTDRTRKTVELR